jgi:hypothetical protein
MDVLMDIGMFAGGVALVICMIVAMIMAVRESLPQKPPFQMKIVSGKQPRDFNECVEAHLRKGWVPDGPVRLDSECYSDLTMTRTYENAMKYGEIKVDEDD